MDLIITRYPANRLDRESFGIDWKADGRPAVERCFPTEEAARAAAAQHFPGTPVVAVRTYGAAK
jgi:hypothetical protein